MNDQPVETPAGAPGDLSLEPSNEESKPAVRSLKELIDVITGRSVTDTTPQQDAGLAEAIPFPFLALVGQAEMKLALVLNLINPAVGGVLLIGPRGTGKTTAVRSLLDLLPNVMRSTCFFGCLPEDIEAGGIDAVCPECARKFGEGQPLAVLDQVRMVELPLNAELEDVVGGLDERALVHERLRLKRGILAQADRNLLYVDEVNLLDDSIMDAILDAAAQGLFTVRRGPLSATYRARFSLIGSMNPEEGNLRPQIMDRFGLRVITRGLTEADARLEAYRRVKAYLTSPRQMVLQYAAETGQARDEIQVARDRLPQVMLPEELAKLGISLIQTLQVDSLRAEITLFESARALASADGRTAVTRDDLSTVAPMALRLRRSKFITDYFNNQHTEEEELTRLVHTHLSD